MRKFGIASLILLVMGIFLNVGWLLSPSSKYEWGLGYIYGLLSISGAIIVGLITLKLVAISLEMPGLAGSIALGVSVPGIFLWGAILIFPVPVLDSSGNGAILSLLYLASSIVLFIGGWQVPDEHSDKPKSKAAATKSLHYPQSYTKLYYKQKPR
ncbi:hypothetical protein [Candidatus Chlorohelix sp.]|uniref:hypothetical protein n=1 Tax=Candidatus Chlorohelix sp. TaxID=3139201 RepID=UPI003046E022